MHNKLANNHSLAKSYATGLAVPVRELHAGHRSEILSHLLQLGEEDRRLRFGTQTPDEVIHHYVEGLDFNKDAVFGVFDADLKLIGMAHLAYLPEIKGEPLSAEFGVSRMSPACRFSYAYCLRVLPVRSESSQPRRLW